MPCLTYCCNDVHVPVFFFNSWPPSLHESTNLFLAWLRGLLMWVISESVWDPNVPRNYLPGAEHLPDTTTRTLSRHRPSGFQRTRLDDAPLSKQPQQ